MKARWTNDKVDAEVSVSGNPDPDGNDDVLSDNFQERRIR